MLNELELKIPPVLVVFIAANLMWLISNAFPAFSFSVSVNAPLAIVFALLGLASGLAGVLAFRKVSTTVNPTRPEASTTLVISGVYHFSRNPMYLGLLFLLISWALYLDNPASCLFILGYVLYMNRFQINPEERALLAQFGDQFSAYCKTVRRWL